MAGNYAQGSDVGSYSHPQFTMQQRFTWAGDCASASAVQFAQFASRNKVLVDRASIIYTSGPSATAGTLCVIFYDTALTATTLKALTIAACSAGYATTVTFTAKTLETISQHIACVTTNNEKGDAVVVYEYQVLYPDTYA